MSKLFVVQRRTCASDVAEPVTSSTMRRSMSPAVSSPTSATRSQRAPTATTFCATLAAPPRACFRSRTRTTGTGASGEMRSTSPLK